MCSIREVYNYTSTLKCTIVNLSAVTKSSSLLNKLFIYKNLDGFFYKRFLLIFVVLKIPVTSSSLSNGLWVSTPFHLTFRLFSIKCHLWTANRL